MSIERGKYTVILGIDGTGKTSTAEEIHQNLKSRGVPSINYDRYKEKQINPHTSEKKRADREGNLEERLVAYLASTMYHGERVSKLLDQGFHIVKSRYLDDVMAHFSHLGMPQDRLKEIVDRFPMVQPDLKVILTLDESIRRQRINKRGALDERDVENKVPGSRALFFEDYLRSALAQAPEGSVLHVDTGKFDVPSVAKKIVDYILRRP